MKCPRCGSEMELDQHRRAQMFMCYVCGYIEDQNAKPLVQDETNFQHLMKLTNINEVTAFISNGLGVEGVEIKNWLESYF